MAKRKLKVEDSTEIQFQAGDPAPFLKWAGGKRQLVSKIAEHFPKKFKTYAEPFIGGGAFFFHLRPKHAILSDINSELINCYRVVRDTPAELIEALKKHIYESDYYYRVRSEKPEKLSAVEQAARTIYLNRVGFNGLYRVNSKGEFNVPFGKYTNPRIVNEENLYACSTALKGIILENIPFQDFPWEIFAAGDFVYFDPPYVPLTKTSNFTDYTKEGFGPVEQEKLAQIYHDLDKRGVQVMLSNSGTELVEKLYKGFKIVECKIPRFINSKATNRGSVTEYVVINY